MYLFHVVSGKKYCFVEHVDAVNLKTMVMLKSNKFQPSDILHQV